MAVSVDNLFNSIPCSASIRHSCGSSFFTPGTGSLIVFHGDPLNPGHTEIWRMALLGFGGALIVCGVRESDPRSRFRVDAPWRCWRRNSSLRWTSHGTLADCYLHGTIYEYDHQTAQTQTQIQTQITDQAQILEGNTGASVFVCG